MGKNVWARSQIRPTLFHILHKNKESNLRLFFNVIIDFINCFEIEKANSLKSGDQVRYFSCTLRRIKKKFWSKHCARVYTQLILLLYTLNSFRTLHTQG